MVVQYSERKHGTILVLSVHTVRIILPLNLKFHPHMMMVVQNFDSIWLLKFSPLVGGHLSNETPLLLSGCVNN